MKKIYFTLISLLAFSYSNATIINVPADQPTIQAGINVAINGDTVLVQPGTYVENINYNGKNITVASLFLTTQDTGYISQTIIDGGNGYTRVVIFYNGEDSTAVLCGFTLTKGNSYKGGGICCVNSNPKLKNLKVTGNTASRGGGIALENSSALIQDVSICHNSAYNDATGGGTCSDAIGGGIYCVNSDPVLMDVIISKNIVCSLREGATKGGGMCIANSDPLLINVDITHNTCEPGNSWGGGGGICSGSSPVYLSNVTITGNSANIGGGIMASNIIFDSINRCNIFLNHAYQGNDLYNSSDSIMEVVVDTFTVLYPTDFFASPIENFSFDILNGFTEIEQVMADLYVSPSGDNTNSGLNEYEPLKTIGQALAKILADSLHPQKIHLLEGTYSQSSNNELFPLYVRDYITLSGESQNGIILDAEGQSMVIIVDSRNGIRFSNFTITGGSGGLCGGIFCKNSNLVMENIKLLDNAASFYGGAIYFRGSEPIITNCIIADNQGFGIHCYGSTPNLINVSISNNSSEGIYCRSSHPIITNSILWNDSIAEIIGSWYGYSSVTIKYSDIQEGEEGFPFIDAVYWLEGNIDQDPLFIGTGDHPYALSAGSPCIDAGWPADWYMIPAWDLLGNERIFDGDGDGSSVIDMGAYEFVETSSSFLLGDNPILKPSETGLQIYPNPFSDELTINYTLPVSSYTKIDIHNSTGEKIKELFSKLLSEGKHVYNWKAKDLPPGIYFIRLQARNDFITKKIIKLK